MLSFFPPAVLDDEIWDLIESVSEGFLTYSSTDFLMHYLCFEKTDIQQLAIEGRSIIMKFWGVNVKLSF